MFPGDYIAYAFITMILIAFRFSFFDKRGFVTLSKIMLIVVLIGSMKYFFD